MSDDPQALLDFWFGAQGTPGCDELRMVWFRSDDAFDAALGERFGALHETAAEGGVDRWAETPEGALALVLLLDQLPRNLYRGAARAFSCDAKAREVASRALARGFDASLTPVRRLFLYLPFEHSEDLADQVRSVRLFAAIPPCTGHEAWLEIARKHHAIIDRFGRFPHRNRALGRASTPEEEAFLNAPDSSF
ncbi:MAG TPA: DUF924 family protein [Stellaceae bacterium]|nr:DUF924 family protein [Stellaceae bacterium]